MVLRKRTKYEADDEEMEKSQEEKAQLSVKATNAWCQLMRKFMLYWDNERENRVCCDIVVAAN